MNKINTVVLKDKLFQQRLNKLADPPKSLYYTGVAPVYDRPAIAIVGSRKPTPYGEEMTYRLSYDLAKQGIVIISGLALGVDGIAHRAALDAGGITIAVLAGGVDQVYPHQHRTLAQKILESGGTLISEYPPGTTCKQYQFIARNRIVAALADGLLVTEAAAKSGTLHTANFALDIGNTVMAAPGQATNPMATGCLNLLKTGASLVTDADDICFALGWQKAAARPQLPLSAQSAAEQTLLALLEQGVQDGEELLARSNLSAAEFNQALSMLEISGTIKALGANHWTLS
jgi:DNA processing protein